MVAATLVGFLLSGPLLVCCCKVLAAVLHLRMISIRQNDDNCSLLRKHMNMST